MWINITLTIWIILGYIGYEWICFQDKSRPPNDGESILVSIFMCCLLGPITLLLAALF